MKSKFYIIFLIIFLKSFLHAEEIFIQAKSIAVDKNNEITIFKDKVFLKTKENKIIKSDYAEYNKKSGKIKLKGNIEAIDNKKNKVKTQLAEYDELGKIFISKGSTTVTTSENYRIESEDIIINDKKNFISSDKNTILIDPDKNKILLENFKYTTKENIFKSIGYIQIKDVFQNSYEFSQIYIDTKQKEILGTDVKAFLNNKNFKINKKNKPRIFANTLKIENKNSLFKKSIFTLCDYRANDKCPPWTIQASETLHDSKKKTIYYDNAIVKVYDVPIFYFPKLSHPDPSVKRRSGFLPPSFSDSKNLGSGISVPYFLALSNDKNFTLTNKLYVTENPLFLGEYHQAFKDSNFYADFGYTEGYKKKTNVKKAGEKSHFFSKFVKNFNFSQNSKSTLNLSVEDVSNDKYLKLYKIKSNLVDYNTDTLNNSLDFTHEDENIFFGLNASVYETLNENYNDKYEYILPEITIDKNLITTEKLGSIDLQTNYKIHNYDTNKFTNFLVNDLSWNYNQINFKSGLKGNILGHLKILIMRQEILIYIRKTQLLKYMEL